MIADIRAHGGVLHAGVEVTSLDELPPARAVLLDTTPHSLIRLAGDRMPASYRRVLERFRYGGGVAKVDFALSDPVPWAHADVARAGTVHIGGTRAGDRRGRERGGPGRPPRRPLRLSGATDVVRLHACARGQARAVGLHARSVGESRRPRRRRRPSDRAFRPGLPRHRVGVVVAHGRRHRRMEPQLPRRRHLGGRPHTHSAPGSPGLQSRSVAHADEGRVPVLVIDQPRPGRARLAGWQAALSALRHEFGTRLRPDLAPRDDQLSTATR